MAGQAEAKVVTPAKDYESTYCLCLQPMENEKYKQEIQIKQVSYLCDIPMENQGSGNNRKKFANITKKSTKDVSAADWKRVGSKKEEGKVTRKNDSQGLCYYDGTTTGTKQMESK